MSRKKQKPLSAKEICFAERCFEHGNATRAFREVGFADSVKEGSVRELASRLVKKRQVYEYIRELVKVAKESGIARVRAGRLASPTTARAHCDCLDRGNES